MSDCAIDYKDILCSSENRLLPEFSKRGITHCKDFTGFCSRLDW